MSEIGFFAICLVFPVDDMASCSMIVASCGNQNEFMLKLTCQLAIDY